MAGKLLKLLVKHKRTGAQYMRYFKTRKGYNAAKKAGGLTTKKAAGKATTSGLKQSARVVERPMAGTGHSPTFVRSALKVLKQRDPALARSAAVRGRRALITDLRAAKRAGKPTGAIQHMLNVYSKF